MECAAETAEKQMPSSGGGKEKKNMKRMYAKMMCLAAGLQRRIGKILHDEEGMGTVEVILIILEIFTQKWMLVRNFFSVGNKTQMYIDYKEMN